MPGLEELRGAKVKLGLERGMGIGQAKQRAACSGDWEVLRGRGAAQTRAWRVSGLSAPRELKVVLCRGTEKLHCSVCRSQVLQGPESDSGVWALSLE